MLKKFRNSQSPEVKQAESEGKIAVNEAKKAQKLQKQADTVDANAKKQAEAAKKKAEEAERLRQKKEEAEQKAAEAKQNAAAALAKDDRNQTVDQVKKEAEAQLHAYPKNCVKEEDHKNQCYTNYLKCKVKSQVHCSEASAAGKEIKSFLDKHSGNLDLMVGEDDAKFNERIMDFLKSVQVKIAEALKTAASADPKKDSPKDVQAQPGAESNTKEKPSELPATPQPGHTPAKKSGHQNVDMNMQIANTHDASGKPADAAKSQTKNVDNILKANTHAKRKTLTSLDGAPPIHAKLRFGQQIPAAQGKGTGEAKGNANNEVDGKAKSQIP
jgi:hypothetical protein